jgi:hypothetical protein
MGAYYRRRGEDRATEVFATTLAGAPQLVERIARHVGLPPCENYAIETQVTSPAAIVDLEVRGVSSGDADGWLLWSEHKLYAPFGAGQLRKYAERMRETASGVQYRLIAITQYAPDPHVVKEAHALDVHLLRWRDIVRMTADVGRDIGGPAWRTQPVAGPLEQVRRGLLDWLSFCANEVAEVETEPLTTERIELLTEARKAHDTLEYLLESAVRRACEAVGAGKPREKADYWEATGPELSWPFETGAKLFAQYDEDDIAKAPTGEFAFIAGVWAEGDAAEILRGRSDVAERLTTRGFGRWDEEAGKGAYLEFGRTLALERVATVPSLDEQEAMVSEFVTGAFRAVLG